MTKITLNEIKKDFQSKMDINLSEEIKATLKNNVVSKIDDDKDGKIITRNEQALNEEGKAKRSESNIEGMLRAADLAKQLLRREGVTMMQLSGRHSGVDQAIVEIKRNDWSNEAVRNFAEYNFNDYPDVYMTDLSKKEVNKIFDKAAHNPVQDSARQVAARMNGEDPAKVRYGAVQDLAEEIANQGNAPSTWRLANKLSPENWGHLMEAFSRMDEAQQRLFAAKFADPSFSGEKLILDGLEKLSAISLQKTVQAKALGKTEVTSFLGDRLGKMAMIIDRLAGEHGGKTAAEVLDFYAKVLDELPKDFARGLTNPDNARALIDKLFDEMAGRGMSVDHDQLLSMVHDLKQVYSERQSEVPIPNVPSDHPDLGWDK